MTNSACDPDFGAAVIPARQAIASMTPTRHVLLVALPVEAGACRDDVMAHGLVPGSMLYLPPRDYGRVVNPFDVDAFLLGFKSSFLEDRHALQGLKAVARPHESLHDPFVTDLVTLAIGHRREPGMIQLDERAEALIVAALIRIADRLAGHEVQVLRSDPALAASLDFISENLSRRIDLEQIAMHAGLSQFQLSRLFRERLGTSVHQHILSERCRLAVDLLTTTNEALPEVAYRAGFSSQSHMTTVMKDRLGTTPGRLRRERRLRPAQ